MEGYKRDYSLECDYASENGCTVGHKECKGQYFCRNYHHAHKLGREITNRMF